MALIKCNQCGQMFSDKATKCPKCGASVQTEAEIVNPTVPAQKKGVGKIVGICVAVVVVVAAIAFFALNNKQTSINAEDAVVRFSDVFLNIDDDTQLHFNEDLAKTLKGYGYKLYHTKKETEIITGIEMDEEEIEREYSYLGLNMEYSDKWDAWKPTGSPCCGVEIMLSEYVQRVTIHFENEETLNNFIEDAEAAGFTTEVYGYGTWAREYGPPYDSIKKKEGLTLVCESMSGD